MQKLFCMSTMSTMSVCLALFCTPLLAHEGERYPWSDIISDTTIRASHPSILSDTLKGRLQISDTAAYSGLSFEVRDTITGTVFPVRISADGSYSAIITGSGIYRIRVRGIGFEVKDTIVLRDSAGSGQIPVATLTLAAAPRSTVLPSVNIAGSRRPRPARSTVNRSIYSSDPTVASVANAQSAGSLFGIPDAQSTYLFNGMDVGPDGLLIRPRGSVSSALTGYQSMGAVFLSRLGGGVSRNLTKKHNFEFRLEPEALTWQSRDGHSAGDRRSIYQLGVSSTIPLSVSRYTLSTRLQYLGGYNRTPSLKTLSAPSLSRLGVSHDSLARFYTVLDALGIPSGSRSKSDRNANNGASVQLALNFNSGSDTSGLVGSVSFLGTIKKEMLPVGLLSLPTTSGSRESQVFGLSTNFSFYIGRTIISNLDASLVHQSFTSAPRYRLPGVSLQLSSTDKDSLTTFATVAMGGSGTDRSQSSTQNFRVANSFTWHPDTSKSFQRTVNIELYGSRSNALSSLNPFGSYNYMSLEELEANAPTRFSRTINENIRKSGELRYSASLREGRFAPWGSNRISFQYVIRIEGQRVNARPVQNDTVESVFGISSTVTPRSWGINPSFIVQKNFGKSINGFVLNSRTDKSLRGTFELSAQMTEGIVTNDRRRSIYATSGQGASVYQLSCIGSAVPYPDWAEIAGGQWQGPEECSTGGGITQLANNSRVYNSFDKSYSVPRSFLTTLAIPFSIGYSLRFIPSMSFVQNTKMESESDINFSGVQGFTLGNEANRPVFVPVSAILEQSGQVSPIPGRRDSRFDRVRLIRSDGRSTAANFSLSVHPYRGGMTPVYWTLNYRYHSGRALTRGFTATTGSDPRVLSHQASSTPSHSLRGTLHFNPIRKFSIISILRLESGFRFTPLVIGDINGDGYSNDRAFIFDPEAASTHPQVAAGISSLLKSAPSAVQKCLKRQINSVATANSCTGPWSLNMDLQASLSTYDMFNMQRIRVDFINTLSGLDRLINGWHGMKGWGQSRSIDPSLLRVTGFNSTIQQFQYEVNSRFGSARSGSNAIRAPFALVVSGQVPLGTSFERVLIGELPAALNSYADTVKYRNHIYTAYAANGFFSIQIIKRLVDSLSLSADQRQAVLSLADIVLDSSSKIWLDISDEMMQFKGRNLAKRMKALSEKGKRHSRQLLYFFGREMQKALHPEQWTHIQPGIRQTWDPKWSTY